MKLNFLQASEGKNPFFAMVTSHAIEADLVTLGGNLFPYEITTQM